MEFTLTAGHIQIAGLLVEWKKSQVHRTGTSQGHSYTVKDISVGEHPHVQIRLQNVVKTTHFLVTKEGIRHPNFRRICHGEVPNFICKRNNVRLLKCFPKNEEKTRKIGVAARIQTFFKNSAATHC